MFDHELKKEYFYEPDYYETNKNNQTYEKCRLDLLEVN